MEGKHVIMIIISIVGMIYSIYDHFFALDDFSVQKDTSSICEAFKDEEIKLHHRALDTIPHNLAVMECIYKMNLSHNRFTELPNLTAFPSITEVDLSYNQITELPSLQDNPRIELLDLSYNQISSISAEELLKCEDLQYLHLKGNTELASLPEEITYLQQLKRLDIRKTKLAKDHPAVRKLMRSIPKVSVYWYSNGDELRKR